MHPSTPRVAVRAIALPSLRPLRLALMGLTVLSLSLLASRAFAAGDPSLPYQNYPGFQCLMRNSQGYCTSFTYNDRPSRAYDNYNDSYRYNDGYTNHSSYDPYYNDPYYNNNRYCDDRYNDDYRYDRYYDNYYYDSRSPSSRYSTNCLSQTSVRVTSSPNPARPNQTVTYRLYVRNDGNVRKNVRIWAELDRDTTFVRASQHGRLQRGRVGDEVLWNVAMQAHSSITFTLEARVRPGVSTGDNVELLVRTADSRDTSRTSVYDDRYSRRYRPSYCSDPYYYNNYSRYPECDDDYYDDGYDDRYDDDCYDDDSCDFSVDVYDSSDLVSVNDTISYSIMVRNDSGRGETTDVRALLDPDTVYMSASDGGSSWSRDEVRWRDLYVGPYQSRTLNLRVRVDRRPNRGDVELEVIAGGDRDEEITRIR